MSRIALRVRFPSTMGVAFNPVPLPFTDKPVQAYPASANSCAQGVSSETLRTEFV